MTITLITDRVSWSDGFGKRTRNDGIKFWPERAIGRDPAVNAAEVTAALERRDSGGTRSSGEKLTLREAAALAGISPAGMFKRVRKHGWAAAMAMSD
jgi:hypothetical protein